MGTSMYIQGTDRAGIFLGDGGSKTVFMVADSLFL